MAQDIKVKIRLDDSEFQNLGNDKKQVEDFGKAVGGASQQISEEINRQVRAAESIGNYKRQLRETIRSIQNLSGAYAQLSDAEKSGAVGQAMAQRLSELKAKAGELKDAVSDINLEVKNIASDTLSFDAFKESVQVGRDLFAAFTASMQLAGGETQELQAMISKLAQVYTISNALVSVGTILQKQSAVMTKLRTAQEAGLAAATRLRTAVEGKSLIATKACTIAQAALNAVCKANPYLLLASALIAAVSAMVIYTKKSQESAEAEKRQQEQLKKNREAAQHYADTVGSAIGSSVAKYNMLAESYKACRTEHEKKNWIKDNKSLMDDLKLAVNSVNDADRIFISNQSKVIKALEARAKATALAQLYTEQYQKKVKNDLNGSVANGRFYRRALDGYELSINSEEAKAAGLVQELHYKKRNADPGSSGWTGEKGSYTNYLNEEGLRKLNEYRQAQANALKERNEDTPLKKLLDEWKEALALANQYEKEAGKVFKTGNETKDNKPKPIAGSLMDLQEQKSKFEEKLSQGRLVLDTSEALKQREEFDKKIHDKKVQLGLEADDNSIAGLEKQINQLKEKIKNNQLTVSTEEAQQSLIALENQLTELQIKAEIVPSDTSIAALEKQLSDIQNRYKNGWLNISPEEYKKVTDDLQKKIESEQIRLNIKVDPNIDKLKKLDKEYEEAIKPEEKSSFEKAMDKVYPNPTENMTKLDKNDYELDFIEKQMSLNDKLIESLKKIADAYKELGDAGAEGFNKIQNKISEVVEANDALSDQAVSIEKDNKKIKKQETTWNAVSDSIGNVGSALSALSSVSDNDSGTQVAGIIAESIAQVMLGYATASAQASELGPWAWIAFAASGLALALSTVAQINQATSSAGSFASGGIVRGGSVADGLTAQVSSGELILNSRQQQNLWRIINGSDRTQTPLNGKVQFVLRGQDLYGTLRNYGKQMQKVNKDIGIH